MLPQWQAPSICMAGAFLAAGLRRLWRAAAARQPRLPPRRGPRGNGLELAATHRGLRRRRKGLARAAAEGLGGPARLARPYAAAHAADAVIHRLAGGIAAVQAQQPARLVAGLEGDRSGTGQAELAQE